MLPEASTVSDIGPVPQVELVTAASYAAVLEDFHEGKVDAAFMGSLLAVMAIDREEAMARRLGEFLPVQVEQAPDAIRLSSR